MTYQIEFTDLALKDVEKLKKSGYTRNFPSMVPDISPFRFSLIMISFPAFSILKKSLSIFSFSAHIWACK
jgi:hypothetical protein